MSKKSDLRITKTYRSLYTSMLSLLDKRNFNDITVNDLCLEALVSRATFYAHFNDKYDLFRYFTIEIRKSIVKDVYQFEELEREVNYFIENNKRVLKNIFKYANSEMLSILRDFMASIVDLAIKRSISDEECPNSRAFINFFSGGLLNHLIWIIENDFPEEVTVINEYLYKMIENLTVWDAEQELKDIHSG